MISWISEKPVVAEHKETPKKYEKVRLHLILYLKENPMPTKGDSY
jgi:hypothetical protein